MPGGRMRLSGAKDKNGVRWAEGFERSENSTPLLNEPQAKRRCGGCARVFESGIKLPHSEIIYHMLYGCRARQAL